MADADADADADAVPVADEEDVADADDVDVDVFVAVAVAVAVALADIVADSVALADLVAVSVAFAECDAVAVAVAEAVAVGVAASAARSAAASSAIQSRAARPGGGGTLRAAGLLMDVVISSAPGVRGRGTRPKDDGDTTGPTSGHGDFAPLPPLLNRPGGERDSDPALYTGWASPPSPTPTSERGQSGLWGLGTGGCRPP